MKNCTIQFWLAINENRKYYYLVAHYELIYFFLIMESQEERRSFSLKKVFK